MPEPDGYEYTGLHAIVFLGGSSAPKVAQLVRDLQEREGEDERFRFATEIVGGVHRGLVHVAVADQHDLAGLQELILELSDDVGLDTDVAVLGPPYVAPSGQTLAAKIRHCEVLAITRIWVERGHAGEVLNGLQGAVGDVFDGASIVYGSFDILLVLDGPDYGSVAGPALEAVPTVPGIVRTETSFADVRRYGDYAEEG
ncbi:MAG TPA: hypothetical protein VFQ40_05695 [Actinomycetota bacterium]|nr:hypothetical protein [Actinomycetota bacterium]